jgi:hypothetical protein
MIYGIDVKVIAALIALFGVFFASVLSAGAYFYKIRVESQKSTKKSLYYLLEIRYFILTSLFDPEKAAEAYIEHYCNHLSVKGIKLTRQDFESNLIDLIRGHFENIITTLKTKVENDLVQPYEDSLLELATINPVLAYSLKGREKLGELLSQAKNYSESVPENIEIPEGMDWLTDLVPDISTEMSEKTMEESLSQLEDDITALAKTCGRKTYKNTKEMLKKRLTVDDKDIFFELDSYMDQVMEKMMAAYKSSLTEEKVHEVE